jgi:ZIP family zinc transporter
MLSFAAGIMIGIVCFGLVPESTDVSSTAVSIIGLVAGILLIMLFNRLIDRFTTTTGDLKVHHTHEELYHADQILRDRAKMLRSGIVMLVAISLHNLPEGLAIGAGSSHDIQLGIILVIMISLHNIPEGMAIAAPLLAGGMGRIKVVLITALSGAPTIIGGIIGILVGNISDAALAMTLSVAGGAMLYVVFGEIIPQSIVMTKNRLASIITLSGIIAGLALTLL